MMKVLYVVLIIVAALIVVSSLFLVPGEGLLPKYAYSKDSSSDAVATDNDEGGEIEAGGSGFSSAGEEAGSNNAGEESVGLDCEMEEVQYSLKSFREEMICIENGIGGCVNLVASCSMEVYNFGDTGIFEVEYSLVDSDGEELDSALVQHNVEGGGVEIFSADFVITGADADEDSDCPFVMKTIPLREVCN